MTTNTDVRAWLREEGHAVGDRGAIPAELRTLYDDAHRPVIPGQVIGPDDAGVSDDDFPAAADRQAPPLAPPAGPPPAADTGERRPRPVRGSRKVKWPKIFGRKKRRGRAARERIPRTPLGDWAEETWLDLAWLAQPLPPLSMLLELQAPYAGVVLDEHVQGTVIDDVLQPVARYSGAFRALNGLVGPPVCVLMVCLEGGRDEQTGELDGRTKMMIGMLRYSLMQMVKTSDVSAEQVQERTESLAVRSRIVDMMVNRIFGWEQQPGGAPPPGPDDHVPTGPPVSHAYQYPETPVMDTTGADPNR